MIKRVFILFTVIFSVTTTCYSNLSQANDSPSNQRLDQFYQRTQSMQAEFNQTLRNARGKVIEKSTGQLIFTRPDKFILQYTTPAEQKYISNGKNIWIYDIELEQVSIKSLDDGIGSSPALLLSSNTNVYKYYQVDNVLLKKSNDYQWVQLMARENDMTFERVLLAFSDTTLMQMVLYDSFDQVTELKFFNIQINKPFTDQYFKFIVPEGVDVIGSEYAQ